MERVALHVVDANVGAPWAVDIDTEASGLHALKVSCPRDTDMDDGQWYTARSPVNSHYDP